MIIGGINMPSSSNETKEETKESSSTSSEQVAESSTTVETTSTTETTENEDGWKEVNDQIAQHIEDNKGWAMGTLDENGNEIEDGEPNPDYALWMYVNSLVVDDRGAFLNVTADFKDFTESEKNELASAAQGIVSAYGGEPRTFLEVRNGEESYGGSKALDTTEFKWVE